VEYDDLLPDGSEELEEDESEEKDEGEEEGESSGPWGQRASEQRLRRLLADPLDRLALRKFFRQQPKQRLRETSDEQLAPRLYTETAVAKPMAMMVLSQDLNLNIGIVRHLALSADRKIKIKMFELPQEALEKRKEPKPQPKQPDVKQTTWVTIELVDEATGPIAS